MALVKINENNSYEDKEIRTGLYDNENLGAQRDS
jgi:hypothetical protein